MSKVESFYWNKLSNKSYSFEPEQLFDLCLFACHLGHTLTQDESQHYDTQDESRHYDESQHYKRLLNPEHLVVLSAGPIPHNSIHLLIVTADFVALYRFYWICPFHYHFISCQCRVYRPMFAQL